MRRPCRRFTTREVMSMPQRYDDRPFMRIRLESDELLLYMDVADILVVVVQRASVSCLLVHRQGCG